MNAVHLWFRICVTFLCCINGAIALWFAIEHFQVNCNQHILQFTVISHVKGSIWVDIIISLLVWPSIQYAVDKMMKIVFKPRKTPLQSFPKSQYWKLIEICVLLKNRRLLSNYRVQYSMNIPIFLWHFGWMD